MEKKEDDQTLLQEEYFKNLDNLQEGSLVNGTVVSVANDFVTVSIGYKSDGFLPLSQFDSPPELGSAVKVLLVKKEAGSGGVELSKTVADTLVFKSALKNAFQQRIAVNGQFASVIKGGYEVDLGHGYRGFVPASKADIKRIEKPEVLLGIKAKFFIETLILEKKNSILLNRQNVLLEERQKLKELFFAAKKEGDVVEGVVKVLTPFGAFIDLGGIEGFLHINDVSWGHRTKIHEHLEIGEKAQVKIIKIDRENQKINLSIKHLLENPWNNFEKKYHIADVVQAKVVNLVDFGAFVELEEGIEGLVHVSEMSWIKHVSHPKEIVKIEDRIEVKILSYDAQNTRLALGLKQVMANPWDEVVDKYPVGKVINAMVKKITPVGAIIKLEEGISGFLHKEDLSWTKKNKNMPSFLKEGQCIDVKVLSLDKENRKIKLGVKQISEDPWISLSQSTSPGSVIEGVIVNKAEFGVFVRIPGDIEGLIPKSALCDSRDQSPDDLMKQLNIGDKIKTIVTSIQVKEHKLALSLRNYVKKEQTESISQYIHQEKDHTSFILGDLIKK